MERQAQLSREPQTALFRDAHLHQLLRESSRRYLGWDEFLTFPLPEGLSAMQTWEVLTSLRHATSISWGFVDQQGSGSWYSPTLQLRHLAERIQMSCGPDSPLSIATLNSQGRHYYVGSQIDEICGALAYDELSIDRDRVSALLRAREAPNDPTERITWNALRMMDNLSPFENLPFGMDLLEGLLDELTQGVDPSWLEEKCVKKGAVGQDLSEQGISHGQRGPGEGELVDPSITRERASLTFAYANGEVGDPEDIPLARLFAIRTSLSQYQPLPALNNIVTRFVSSLYAIRHGLPLLSILPVTLALRKWSEDHGIVTVPSQGPLVASQESIAPRSVNPTTGEADATPFLTYAFELTERLTRELSEKVSSQLASDHALLGRFSESTMLNHRQLDVIGMAISQPIASVTIRAHQLRYGIAYATARADLLGLVGQGLLRQAMRGHAYVFEASPELLARCEPSAEP